MDALFEQGFAALVGPLKARATRSSSSACPAHQRLSSALLRTHQRSMGSWSRSRSVLGKYVSARWSRSGKVDGVLFSGIVDHAEVSAIEVPGGPKRRSAHQSPESSRHQQRAADSRAVQTKRRQLFNPTNTVSAAMTVRFITPPAKRATSGPSSSLRNTHHARAPYGTHQTIHCAIGSSGIRGGTGMSADTRA